MNVLSQNEYVTHGLNLIIACNYSEAEEFLLKGIDELEKSQDKEGITHALDRLGFCYEKLMLIDKAKDTYEKAIKIGTNISLTYNSLITILVLDAEFDRAFEIADIFKYSSFRKLDFDYEKFIKFSSILIKKGRGEEALSLLNRTLTYFPVDIYPYHFWQIKALIGLAYEKTENLEKAMTLYRETINEGSFIDPMHQRYLDYLEKHRENSTVIKYSEKALEFQNYYLNKVDLEKRLMRLKKKINIIPISKCTDNITRKSIKKVEKTKNYIFKIEFSPQLNFPVIHHNFLYGITGGKIPKLVCYCLDSQDRVWETTLDGHASGLTVNDECLIALTTEGRIGEGQTSIYFFNSEGSLLTIQKIPDIHSEISGYGGRLYVGCRDGNLYAFSITGKLLWSYKVRDTRGKKDDNRMRPCPYYVSAGTNIVAFSSFKSLYVLNPNGDLQYVWKAKIKWDALVEDDVMSVSVSTGNTLIWDVKVITDSGKVLVSAQSGVYELYDRKTKRVKNVPETDNYSICDVDNDSYMICGFKNVLLVENGQVQRKIAVSSQSKAAYNPKSNRIVVWSWNKLKVMTQTSELLGEIEFSKGIRKVHIFDNGQILVATNYVVMLDSRLGKDPSEP